MYLVKCSQWKDIWGVIDAKGKVSVGNWSHCRLFRDVRNSSLKDKYELIC